jgi:O-antigen/teichoic acid export membrane protein
LFTRPQLERSIVFFKTLISFGGWVSVSGIVGPLMIYGDRFFVSAMVGPALLPIYAIPQEALQRLLIFPNSFTNALLPKIVGLNGGQLKERYTSSFRRTAWFMLLVCSLAVALAYPGLRIWISADFAQSAMPIVVILSVGIWLNSIASIPYTFIHSIGNAKITALIHMAELGIYFLLLYVLVKQFGLVGAALAWTIRVGIDLVLLQIAVKKCFIEKEGMD